MVRGRLITLTPSVVRMFYAVKSGRQCGIFKTW